MADIKLKDLATHNFSGVNLFDDSESFMVELSNEYEIHILGGMNCEMSCRNASCSRNTNDVCYRTALDDIIRP